MPEKGEKMPCLSEQRIIVIADYANRSQYDLIDGFARHPCATRILAIGGNSFLTKSRFRWEIVLYLKEKHPQH
jgi:hypothetical protein